MSLYYMILLSVKHGAIMSILQRKVSRGGGCSDGECT